MSEFNWIELLLGVLASIGSYLAGHKVGKKDCDK